MDGTVQLKVNALKKSISRVLFICSGIGITNRGIESFFREAFNGLRSLPDLSINLLKGTGTDAPGERVIWNIPQTSRLARFVGRLTGRSAYAVQQWSTFFPIAKFIQKYRPHVVFYSDANLGFLLYRFRKQIGVPFRLLFSNGGPNRPPFPRTDFVHQVAPYYYKAAMDQGEPEWKHFMVPYGVQVPESPVDDLAKKRETRQRLGLPLHRPVILSVGWIARQHKRMHYVIEEVLRLQQHKPFLQLLGSIDEASPEIIEMGNCLLGSRNFSARCEPYEAVGDFYRAADCFVLASLQEGFGRVYLEALMHGLAVIAHRHPVMEYVLGSQGVLADLSRPAVLADLLSAELLRKPDIQAARARWESVRSRFSWSALAPLYHRMFLAVSQHAVG
jgi:glycosyltransferase involved in cell wall biosynthesis